MFEVAMITDSTVVHQINHILEEIYYVNQYQTVECSFKEIQR